MVKVKVEKKTVVDGIERNNGETIEINNPRLEQTLISQGFISRIDDIEEEEEEEEESVEGKAKPISERNKRAEIKNAKKNRRKRS